MQEACNPEKSEGEQREDRTPGGSAPGPSVCTRDGRKSSQIWEIVSGF